MPDHPAFVWLRTHHVDRPEPQLWHPPFVGTAGKESRIVARHELSDIEAGMSIETLIARYPAPPPKQEE